MSLILDPRQVESLVAFVDRQVRSDGCDHTHRFTEAWARQEPVDWHHLLDILEANGGYCDCEVVMNLPDGESLHSPPATPPAAPTNPWLLPPGFDGDPSTVFTKVIVCQAGLGRSTHTSDGELLVPAPKGAKSRRRIRKSVNFFIGCESGLPTEVGVVRECIETTAAAFARKVAQSGFEELASFTVREACFVLSRIASVDPGKPVATHFADQVGVASRHEELRIHRVIMR